MVCAFCLPLAMFAQQLKQPFYYYKGDKVMLEYNTKHIFVSSTDLAKLKMLNPGTSKVLSSTNVYSGNASKTLTQPENYKVSNPNRFSQEITISEKEMSVAQYYDHINSLKDKNNQLIVAPFFKSNRTDKIGLSNFFYVKLKHQDDFENLTGLIEENNLELIGHNIFMPLWFTISVTPESKDALHMANMFYETGLFEAAEPDLMTENKILSAEDKVLSTEDKMDFMPNDTYFANQWSLKNTGQNGGTIGIDINAEQAWDRETGSPSIIVAVVDHGFSRTHPDLINNNVGSGYDTKLNSTPARVRGPHGTACAGIIAGQGNNGQGITGVAYNASLMSISNTLVSTPNSRQGRANGINWAVNNGAHIISNSWFSTVQTQLLDDAITNALNNGRGGLGCIVVFAAGNDNGAVNYPANSNPGIITVGAMSPCGQRKSPTSCDGEGWGSNFGAQLDVVAPGVLMPTTDRQGSAGYNTNGVGDYANRDYTNDFNGTSSACPIVAGVAALVLSVNPSLTRQQVTNIIEKSAQKTRTDLYNYGTSSARPNGTWNNEMGYGLVDALQAVSLAEDCATTLDITGTVTGELTYHAGSYLNSNQELTTSSDITYRAGNRITLEAGFRSNGESSMSIAACGSGNKQIGTTDSEPISYIYKGNTASKIMSKTASTTELRCFPNPFQSNTTLEYELKQDEQVLLIVTGVNNRVVRVLVDEQQSAGIQSVDFEGGELPSGIYFAKLKFGNTLNTARLLIAK